MAWPPDLADFYAHGIAAAACVPEVRSVKSVDVAASTFVLPSHGLVDGDTVQLVAAGANAALPAPTTAAGVYQVKRLSSHAFQLLLNGTPVVLSAAGSGIVQVLEDVEPKILRILAGCASDLQARATAFLAPWASAPPWAVRRACHLAAPDVAVQMRVASPQFDIAALQKRADVAEAFIEKLEKGMPTAERPVDASPTVLEMAPVAVPLRSDGDFDIAGDGGDSIA